MQKGRKVQITAPSNTGVEELSESTRNRIAGSKRASCSAGEFACCSVHVVVADLRPVDTIEEVADVVGTDVVVLEVVGMLPNINAQHRNANSGPG